MRKLAILLLAAAASGAAAGTPPSPSSSVTVTNIGVPCPDCKWGENVPLHSVARAYHGSYQWPGAYWEADIKGTSFNLILSDKANIFGIYIDGQKVDTQAKPLYTAFRYSGLSDGKHRIRVETQTESQGAPYSGVSAIVVHDKDQVLPAPPPRARQIEFIGDSDMVAYGVASTKRECTEQEVHDTTDTSQSYVARVARHYDADYQVIAYSGIGVVRNYGGDKPHLSMPLLYPRSIFEMPQSWARDGWTPQAIVIAVGGNDFSTNIKPGEKWPDKAALRADWEKTFIAFIDGIRRQNPDAYIVLGVNEGFNDDYFAASQAVYTALSSKDKRLGLVLYPKLESAGCNWHPSQNDHVTMASLIAAHLDQQADIWRGR